MKYKYVIIIAVFAALVVAAGVYGALHGGTGPHTMRRY